MYEREKYISSEKEILLYYYNREKEKEI